MKQRKPCWRFAPNMGGPEQGRNPGQQHFARDALRAMVRETLQNSLDNHEDGLPPVEVSYRLTRVHPKSIQARELAKHVQDCLEELQDDRETSARYQRMRKILTSGRPIPGLAVIDQNTTGLKGDRWHNLLIQEGISRSGQGPTRGGSFGFGKNAAFNLAEAGAVIYSTMYLDIKTRKGRVKHMAGRAQLYTHNHGGERVREAGFLGIHQDNQWNQALEGPEIPEELRIEGTGTGIFILGFPHLKIPGWERQIIQEAVTGFLPAIMWKNLVVRVEGRTIDHRTIREEIQELPANSPTRYYHLALQSKPLETLPSNKLDGMGSLNLWIHTDHQGPRRLAHMNRRGMLITASRERADNPLFPRGGSTWSGWCAVTMAADERTEAWLRRMEPPAHDALHPTQLSRQKEQDQAREKLNEHREQIRTKVQEAIGQNNRRNSSNIAELAELFPLTSATRGRDLELKKREISSNNELTIDIEIPEDEVQEDESNPQGDRKQNRREGGGGRPASAILRNFRAVRSGPSNLLVAFTIPPDRGVVRLGLRAAGEQYMRNETVIRIQGAVEAGGITVTTSLYLDGDEIIVTAQPNTRVNLMVNLVDEDHEYHSYRPAVTMGHR